MIQRVKTFGHVALLGWVLTFALPVWPTSVPPSASTPMTIELPAAVWSGSVQLPLGDLANISTPDLNQLKRALNCVVPVPEPGEFVARISREQLAALLERCLAIRRSDLVWSGAHAVSVHPRTGRIDGSMAAHDALREVRAALQDLAPQAIATLRSAPTDWEPPPGLVALHIRDVGRQLMGAGPRVLWVDAYANGQYVRRLPVGVGLEGAAAMGSMPTHIDTSAAMHPTSMGRNKGVLPPLHTLSASPSVEVATTPTPSAQARSGPPAILRGQPVRLVVRGGGVEIETHAEPLQNGSVGDVIRVRPRKSGEALLARVVAHGEVEVLHGD